MSQKIRFFRAIVNKDKVVLWRSIMCKGSEHDSTAFKKTQLHEKLLASFTNLVNHGLYIVGDSAYAIRSFLLVPFDNARPSSDEDSFNYHHSTCRIWVECAFGEIDMRWGIFWRPLQFSLQNNLQVIDAGLRTTSKSNDRVFYFNDEMVFIFDHSYHSFVMISCITPYFINESRNKVI